MFCKLSALKHFARFTEEHLCQSLVLNAVASRKISENSEENTFAGVSFLVKF